MHILPITQPTAESQPLLGVLVYNWRRCDAQRIPGHPGRVLVWAPEFGDRIVFFKMGAQIPHPGASNHFF